MGTSLLVAVCHSYCGKSLTNFHLVTSCAGHQSSRSNGRGGGDINSCQRFLRVHNFDYVWRLDVCGRASAGEERAQCSM